MSTQDTVDQLDLNQEPKADEVDYIIPNDPRVHKQIRDALEEIAKSKVRAAGERSFQTEAIKKLSEDTKVPKKFLRKLARLGNKQGTERAVSEMECLDVAAGQVFGKTETAAAP